MNTKQESDTAEAKPPTSAVGLSSGGLLAVIAEIIERKEEAASDYLANSELPDEELKKLIKDSDLEEDSYLDSFRALLRGRAIECGNTAAELSILHFQANAC